MTTAAPTKQELIDELEGMPAFDLAGINAELAYRSFKEFILQHWSLVETRPFEDGWHIDVLCDHLEAVTFHRIRKLNINMPPRHMKSLSVSVFWPAWVWLHFPEHQWLFASYAESLSIRDSVKCRRLIQSVKYQALMKRYHPTFRLVGDQNTKIRFENNFGGYRLATSVGGALTGEGGDTLVIDDPHNIIEAESEVKRISATQWWDESMSTRLNDMKTGSKVLMMQRSHENDLSGHVIANEDGWDLLIFPARYEGENRVVSTLDYVDPRTEIDEPLWPAKFGDEELAELEKILGVYGAAGQLAQRPAPRGGGMFKVNKFQLIKEYNPRLIVQSVRYFDKAGTEGGGCFTSGVLIHKMRDDCKFAFLVENVERGQWSYGEREEMIKSRTARDHANLQRFLTHKERPKYQVWHEQEPGSGGKESAERTTRNLAGYDVHAEKVTGDKISRAQPYAIQIEAGNVALLQRDWTEDFINEHEMAPRGTYKDQWDSAAGAFNKLTVAVKVAGTWGKRHGRKSSVRNVR